MWRSLLALQQNGRSTRSEQGSREVRDVLHAAYLEGAIQPRELFSGESCPIFVVGKAVKPLPFRGSGSREDSEATGTIRDSRFEISRKARELWMALDH